MQGIEAFEDLRDSFAQDNDAERRRCVVVWFAWFVQDNAIGLLHGLAMMSVGDEGSEQRWKEQLVGLVDLLPDRVRNTTWARG